MMCDNIPLSQYKDNQLLFSTSMATGDQDDDSVIANNGSDEVQGTIHSKRRTRSTAKSNLGDTVLGGESQQFARTTKSSGQLQNREPVPFLTGIGDAVNKVVPLWVP